MNKHIKKDKALAYKRRFLTHIRKTKNGCWEWMGSRDSKNYGRIRLDDQINLAHRVAWVIFFDEIPKNKCICHKCDNPPCCNPHHLFIGTLKDNSQDCINKNRRHDQRGEKHHLAKLTEQDVIKIRKRRNTGEYLDSIANDFNVTKSMIWCIIANKNWKHI